MSDRDAWDFFSPDPGRTSDLVARSADLVGRGLALLESEAPRPEASLAEVERRAQAGDANAQRELGAAYSQGLGVPQDDAQAARWFLKAAEKGDAGAQSHLAWAHALGLGVAKDATRAAHWWRQAAEQGRADDQFEMGWLHAYGFCVAENATTAAWWYRRAAEQGHAGAQANLGWCFANGRGVPPDSVEALKWTTLAAALARPWDDRLGDDQRVALEARMSRVEVEEAGARAQAWLEAFHARRPLSS